VTLACHVTTGTVAGTSVLPVIVPMGRAPGARCAQGDRSHIRTVRTACTMQGRGGRASESGRAVALREKNRGLLFGVAPACPVQKSLTKLFAKYSFTFI